MTSWLRVAVGWAVALAAMTPAWAAYPDKPVRVLVPYAAGGANDQVARFMAGELQQRFGQPFVVENRPGAGGVVGMTALRQADPDGYTIAIGEPGSVTINPQLTKTPPYAPREDFIPLAMAGQVPLIVISHPAAGITSLAGLKAYGERNNVAFGSAGHGTVQHLTMELLRDSLGMNLTHVPYRGGAPALNDLVGGQIPLLPITVPTALPHIKAGTVTPVAALSRERSRHLPDLATAGEQGYPSVNVTIWLGFFAPAGTPAEIVDRLSEAMQAVLANPAAQQKLADLGVDVVPMNRAQFVDLIDADITRWGDIIQSRQIVAQ